MAWLTARDGCRNNFADVTGIKLSFIFVYNPMTLSPSDKLSLLYAKPLQRALAIADIGGRDMDRMRQAVRIDRQVTLDAADLFASVIAFLARRVGVLDALGIDNAERRLRGRPSRSRSCFT